MVLASAVEKHVVSVDALNVGCSHHHVAVASQSRPRETVRMPSVNVRGTANPRLSTSSSRLAQAFVVLAPPAPASRQRLRGGGGLVAALAVRRPLPQTHCFTSPRRRAN